tara:strand:- start:43 stop:1416 length:1374 start_codon:yes stop_codon:yes gene_type:complete
MTSKIKVDNISDQSDNNIINESGDVITVGAAGDTVAVAGNIVKSNALQASDGGNIVNQSGTTITLGASGDTIALASGASQTGFGRTGTVDWQTTVKTSTFTAANGEGYFVDTTSGSITVNLPAGSAGAIVSISDYAGTADTNNIVISSNGSEKIEGSTDDKKITAEREAVTIVYIDSTQGWISVQDANVGGTALLTTYNVNYLVVAGGGGSRSFSDTSGGGGAGGYRTAGFGPAPLQGAAKGVVPGTLIPITVGGGGSAGSKGSDSIFSTITSTGGGTASGGTPTAGGSGGASCGAGNTPPVSPPQGNPAGGGGGGGALCAGADNPSPSQGGKGGAGAPNCIGSGTPFSRTVFAGGGAGGSDPPGSSPQPNNPGGAPGGGGVGGSRPNNNSTDGSTNSGGGAGGQGANHPGQSGGSGVVIIRYTTADAPGSATSTGTTSTVGSCTVHVFTGPGTFTA